MESKKLRCRLLHTPGRLSLGDGGDVSGFPTGGPRQPTAQQAFTKINALPAPT
ncbi:MAG TPA: hypothetical protein VI094_14690 [Propionibacteriaceae bacterium]